MESVSGDSEGKSSQLPIIVYFFQFLWYHLSPPLKRRPCGFVLLLAEEGAQDKTTIEVERSDFARCFRGQIHAMETSFSLS